METKRAVKRVDVAGGLMYRYRDGVPEVLLIDDRFGHVALPKGHAEPGELLEETALREVLEETGMSGRVVTPLATISYRAHTDGEWVEKDAHYFLLEAKSGTITPQEEEIQGARFVTLEEAEALMLEKGYDNNRELVARGIALLRAKGETLTRLADCIDHTLLAPQATPYEVDRLCREALCYGFKSVCVNPLYVRACQQRLSGSGVEVCTVIGFPLGATGLENKAAEARQALEDGATELDMVVAIGLLKAGHTDAVLEEIRAVVEAAKGRAIVKVILETPLLSPEQQQVGAELCKRAGADFVKTCTGFAGGATEEAVGILRRTVGNELGVKASGGIRDRETAMRMIAAGASRIGASAGPALCREPFAP